MEFIQCPAGYCCSQKTAPCASYNTCAAGRKGYLCGSCSTGYSQSFISNGCVKKAEVKCSASIFAMYFIIVSVMYTIIFSFIPYIVEEVKNKVEERKQPTENMIEMNECESPMVLSRRSFEDSTKPSNKRKPLPLSAFITLVCFYLQVASLVHVDVHARNTPDANNPTDDNASRKAFIKSLFDFFNFRVIHQRVCPMDDLTLPIKELINVGLKVCSIFNLGIYYLLWKLLLLFKAYFTTSQPHKEGSIDHQGNDEEDVDKISIL